MNDMVVQRLFSAGFALETALGPMGGRPGAAKVQEAVGDLDLTWRSGISGMCCSNTIRPIRPPPGSRTMYQPG